MRFQRNDVKTGVLVLGTLAVLVAVVLSIGSAGFRRQNTYYVYFDNGGGVKPGSDVFLAGRQVGRVIELQSPVPARECPPERPDCQVRIEVQIRKDAKIYRHVTVRMQQYGLLGQQMLDFVNGDEGSGLAASGATFAGERVPGLTEATPALLEIVRPVSEEASATLAEMRTLLGQVNTLTGEGGDLRQAAVNARQFTDTIKRQPWRLVWKSTKKYDGEKDAQRERSKDDQESEQEQEREQARN